MDTTKDMLPQLRFKLHLQHPCLDECWSEGYDYALEELSEEDNPYPPESRANEYWSDGWWAGFYGEERLFASPGASEITNYHKDYPLSAITDRLAVNDESKWSRPAVKKWAVRAAKVAGAVAATIAAVELLDIAL